jgi:hypothetical protein
VQLTFYSDAILRAIATSAWPDLVRYYEEPLPHPSPTKAHKLVGFGRLHALLMQAAFVHFFEIARDEVEDNHGNDPQTWRSPLNFARIVRDAFAHGNSLDVRNPNAAPVCWKGLCYGPADNGRQVAYSDLAAADPDHTNVRGK